MWTSSLKSPTGCIWPAGRSLTTSDQGHQTTRAVCSGEPTVAKPPYDVLRTSLVCWGSGRYRRYRTPTWVVGQQEVEPIFLFGLYPTRPHRCETSLFKTDTPPVVSMTTACPWSIWLIMIHVLYCQKQQGRHFTSLHSCTLAVCPQRLKDGTLKISATISALQLLWDTIMSLFSLRCVKTLLLCLFYNKLWLCFKDRWVFPPRRQSTLSPLRGSTQHWNEERPAVYSAWLLVLWKTSRPDLQKSRFVFECRWSET